MANRLANEVLGRAVDDLPPQTRRLLNLIDDMVTQACHQQGLDRADYRFSRRDVREHAGWGNTQLKVHLKRLEELEYLLVHRGGRGQSFVYELLYEAQGRRRPTLPGPPHRRGPTTTRAVGGKRQQVGFKSALKSVPSRVEVGAAKTMQNPANNGTKA